MISGLALFFGIVGAVCAGTPLRILVDHFGWRNIVLLSSVDTIVIGLCTWLFVRGYPQEKGFKNFTQPSYSSSDQAKSGFLSDLYQVFTYRNTSLLFLIPGGIVGCALTFSGLWGVPYLTSVYGLSPKGAASFSSALLVAWALGGPFFGWFSDKLHNRKYLYLVGSGVSAAGWAIIIFGNSLSLPLLFTTLIITGFSSGCMIISFAFVKESVPLRLAGTVSGVINMGVMMGPMILQPVVGWMLDHRWTGGMLSGLRVYDLTAYRSGFCLMLAWISLSFLLLFFTRDTKCCQQEE